MVGVEGQVSHERWWLWLELRDRLVIRNDVCGQK